jgi:hypothetical protein
MFAALKENNEKIAAEIERAWESAGLTTFKSWLRDDLARRAAAKASQVSR